MKTIFFDERQPVKSFTTGLLITFDNENKFMGNLLKCIYRDPCSCPCPCSCPRSCWYFCSVIVILDREPLSMNHEPWEKNFDLTGLSFKIINRRIIDRLIVQNQGLSFKIKAYRLTFIEQRTYRWLPLMWKSKKEIKKKNKKNKKNKS